MADTVDDDDADVVVAEADVVVDVIDVIDEVEKRERVKITRAVRPRWSFDEELGITGRPNKNLSFRKILFSSR